jgi:hypothetical protein
MLVRRIALIYGIAFLAVGVLGFVPGINHMHHGDPNLSVEGPGTGDLLGLFHVNVLHNAVHLLFGVLGLACAGSISAARGYLRLVAVAYALLVILGLIPTANINHTFGLIPIEGNDVWLHALLAIVAGYFGFIYRVVDTTGTTYTTTPTPPTTPVT